MKKITYFLSIIVLFSVFGCVKTDSSNSIPTPNAVITLTEALVTYPWKVDKITDANGGLINPNSLPEQSKALFGINIQFYDDKTVRALDPIARTVVNGGKWGFLDENKTLDIDISQLKGQFPIVSLKKVLNIPIVQTTWSFGIMYISDSAIAACGPGHLTTQA